MLYDVNNQIPIWGSTSTWAKAYVRGAFSFLSRREGTKLILKRIFLFSAIFLVTGGLFLIGIQASLQGTTVINCFCDPGPDRDTKYSVYDNTTISGQQVENAMNQHKDTLTFIVVRDGNKYVIGENEVAAEVLDINKAIPLTVKKKIIDEKGSYRSLVLRDSNNGEVIGIQFTEKKK